jgi:hypothetical protein
MDARDQPCAGCGAPAGWGAPSANLCPACLFALALGADEDASDAGTIVAAAPAYKVLTVLAAGERHTTYLAEEQQPERRFVTLDVVRRDAEHWLTPERFHERLKALTRLVHPGIARILDGRLTAAGEFCVIGQYVAGPRIDRYCDRRHVPVVDRLKLFLAVCRAIERAHAQGVVHGHMAADRVVVVGSKDAVAPVVTGFTVCSEMATVAGDVSGLYRVFDAVGGPDTRVALTHAAAAAGGPAGSVAALREAVEATLLPV